MDDFNGWRTVSRPAAEDSEHIKVPPSRLQAGGRQRSPGVVHPATMHTLWQQQHLHTYIVHQVTLCQQACPINSCTRHMLPLHTYPAGASQACLLPTVAGTPSAKRPCHHHSSNSTSSRHCWMQQQQQDQPLQQGRRAQHSMQQLHPSSTHPTPQAHQDTQAS